MKLRLFCLLLFCFCLASCKRKNAICHYSIFYLRGTYVAFSGFSAQDLDTIIIRRYQPGSQFQQLVDTVTSFADTNFRKNDIAYCDFNNLNFFISEYDYEYFVKSTNSLFRISDIETGEKSGTREGSPDCSPGSGSAQILPYTSVMVNGKKTTPFNDGQMMYYVLLAR